MRGIIFKMKNKFLLSLFVIFGLLLFTSINSENVNAGSVTISLFYDSITSNSLTIMDGDEFGMVVSADSIFENSMTINLDLLDTNGNLITNILNTYTTQDSYFKHLILTKSSYLQPGNYILRGTIRGSRTGSVDTRELYLKVINNTPGNHPPIIISSPPVDQINEHESFNYQVIATDQDNDPLTYSFVQSPIWLTINNKGLINGIAPEVSSDYQFIATVIVSDGKDFDTQTFTITVKNIASSNNPTLLILKPSPSERVSGTYDVKWDAKDPDQTKESLDIKIESRYNGYDWVVLENGINNNDGIFTWDTRSLSDANNYELRITAADDQGNKDVKEVSFILDNPNAPNVNFIQPHENDVLSGTYNVLWNAHDNDQADPTLDVLLEYRERSPGILQNLLRIFSSDWKTLENGVNNNDGIFTWNTLNLNNGDYELRIIVSDDTGLTATAYLNKIRINNAQANHDPRITSTPVTSAVISQLYTYNVDAVDQDNDPLSYELLIAPIGMIIDYNTGLITWIPLNLGTEFVQVKVKDGKGGFDLQSFNVQVSNVIPPPKLKVPQHIHRFNINNVILNYNNDGLNVYTYLRNEGNQKERITLRATIMQNSLQQITSLNLDKNENKYGILSFGNLDKGFYLVKVEAFNGKDHDMQYAYITV